MTIVTNPRERTQVISIRIHSRRARECNVTSGTLGRVTDVTFRILGFVVMIRMNHPAEPGAGIRNRGPFPSACARRCRPESYWTCSTARRGRSFALCGRVFRERPGYRLWHLSLPSGGSASPKFVKWWEPDRPAPNGTDRPTNVDARGRFPLFLRQEIFQKLYWIRDGRER